VLEIMEVEELSWEEFIEDFLKKFPFSEDRVKRME
jgi:hypothetical protein